MNRSVVARIAVPSFALAAALAAWAAEVQTFGKPLKGLPPGSLQDVLVKPEQGKLVRLEGTIDTLCQNKGCWLELKQGTQSVHVTFEAYSFFVPKDSMGKPCVLEGRVMVKEPMPEEVAHKKAEGAAVAEKRVSIEATGVEIRSK
jgi:hypothetical protein